MKKKYNTEEITHNMFFEDMVEEAITRIRKFAVIARAYGFEIAVGFSGGKIVK